MHQTKLLNNTYQVKTDGTWRNLYLMQLRIWQLIKRYFRDVQQLSSMNFENRWVLRSALNFVSDGEVVREVGREFQRKGPEKAKADLAKECLTRVKKKREDDRKPGRLGLAGNLFAVAGCLANYDIAVGLTPAVEQYVPSENFDQRHLSVSVAGIRRTM
ncbi:hypothetical protein HELRODRAFT_184382 [Helobdella robusta]|uniref:Uncharacterized protein n=1 Tax=Helobdella robusta TaxID=6412 RepID=T1FL35_HELRO|nr:hypothetical protein HELRODRAFT_184382 [Helobdella robusta]ESN99680.1 hypothetical protein HELRODRAFT_184382 [Helobdella robusta]